MYLLRLTIALWLLLVPVSAQTSNETVRTLETLTDQVKAAVERNDWTQALHLVSQLHIGIGTAYRASLPSAKDQLAKLEQEPANAGQRRKSTLSRLALTAFEAGDLPKAEQYAREMLTLGRSEPSYGSAVFYGNTVLGRIALKRDNDVVAANRFLLASAQTPGSPTLKSFGPNMTLARDLLIHGERQTVIEFLNLCKQFWTFSPKPLDQWIALVKDGLMPDFGASLVYSY